MTQYTHGKRGGAYEILHGLNEPVLMQTGITALDMQRMIVYRSLTHDSLWVRPFDEFFDGRFKEIK